MFNNNLINLYMVYTNKKNIEISILDVLEVNVIDNTVTIMLTQPHLINGVVGFDNSLFFPNETVLKYFQTTTTDFKIVNYSNIRHKNHETGVFTDDVKIFINLSDAIIQRNKMIDDKINHLLQKITFLQKNK